MYSKSELETLKNVDFSSYNVGELKDVPSLSFDVGESVESRAERFFTTVGNPYVFRVGDVGVKINCIGDKQLRDSIINISRFY